MTVSSSVGRQLDITRIVQLAYQGIGLLNIGQGTSDPTWDAKFAFGRDMLELIVDGLATRGVMAKARSFYEISITSADVTAKKFKYTLPKTVLDVLEPAMYIRSTETDTERAEGETYIRIISLEEWQRLGTKASTGQPTLIYPDRTGDAIVCYLWQIPDDAGTVRLHTHRKLSDVKDGNATLDLEEYWRDYLVTALQVKLAHAHALPTDVTGTHEIKAESLLEYAVGKARQRGKKHIRLEHGTRWTGRRLTT